MAYNFTPSTDSHEGIGSIIKRWLHGYFINLNADGALTTGASSTVGLYGAAPNAQRASNKLTALTTLDLSAIGTYWAFSSTLALNSLQAAVIEIQKVLGTLSGIGATTNFGV